MCVSSHPPPLHHMVDEGWGQISHTLSWGQITCVLSMGPALLCCLDAGPALSSAVTSEGQVQLSCS